MKISKAAKIEEVASRDLTRVNLYEPFLDVEHKRLMACDGHALAVVPVETEEGDVTGKITSAALKAARAKNALGPDGAAYIQANGSLRLPISGQTFTRPDFVAFPTVEQVIPTLDPDTSLAISFNPDLLLRLCRALGVERDRPIVMRFNTGTDQPFTVEAGSAPGALGVLMPVRI